MLAERQYFGTDGIRGRMGVTPITPEFALMLGWATGRALVEDGQGTVLIGQDTRVSGDVLASALSAGFMASGLSVYMLGVLPTPAIAYLTRMRNAHVGVVVSASHNLYEDNGIKFFGVGGKKLPDIVEKKIESFLSQSMKTVESKRLGTLHYWADAANDYIEFCKNSFLKTHNLHHLKIIVDCAQGATSHVAPRVLSELGADVTMIHATPNGVNINQNSGSTSPQALQSAVVAQCADVGIAFDGDGDRVILVDHRGECVDGDELLFIIAKSYQEQQRMIGGVVGTQMSNLGLEQAFHRLSIPFVRARVGDRYVLDELQNRQWLLGGEASGHIICLDKTTTGDGILSALQVLGAMVHSRMALHELKKGMTKCAQVLLNVPTVGGRAADVVREREVIEAMQTAQSRLATQGRIVLRPSGTEPLVRIMVEGQDSGTIREIAETISQVVAHAAKKLLAN